MNSKKYFDKNGKIYGISDFFSFSKWYGYKIEFDNYENAINWLLNEEHNFMERELVSKTKFNRCKYNIMKSFKA